MTTTITQCYDYDIEYVSGIEFRNQYIDFNFTKWYEFDQYKLNEDKYWTYGTEFDYDQPILSCN